ncbi:MAG: hypothetical protein AAGI66_03430 [Cyanobacteria bacterium P01_H01_bin.74]
MNNQHFQLSAPQTSGKQTEDQNSWGLNRLQTQLKSFRNRIDFTLRNAFCWTWGDYLEKSLPEKHLNGTNLKNGHQTELLATLTKKYFCEESDGQKSLLFRSYRLYEVMNTLFWLDVIEKKEPGLFQICAGYQPNAQFQALDVGAKNWSYVDALAAFIEYQMKSQENRPWQLTGVELDPHRRYVSLKTRGQAARHFSAALPNTAYQVGNVLDWQTPVDLITHFLPFVTVEPLLYWGLPAYFFQPQAILSHCINLLKSKGILVIVNQGEEEYQEQQVLINKALHDHTLSVSVLPLGKLENPFMDYVYPRYGVLVCKH